MSERSLLEDVVGDVLARHSTPDATTAAEQAGAPGELWRVLSELGMAVASVPEEAGGGGADVADVFAVLRLAGRHAAYAPLAETDLLAGHLLASAGLPLADGAMTVAPASPDDLVRAEPQGADWLLAGNAHHVPWGRAAKTIALLARTDEGELVLAVDPAACAIEPGVNLAGEPRDRVCFDGVVVPGSAAAPAGAGFDAVFARGALARAALSLGALERCLALSVEYAGQRVQFGKPIGALQVIQHYLATMSREVALVDAAVDGAVAAFLAGGDATLEIGAAKARAGQATTTVAALAHQVHGAIGFTNEFELQLLTRRLWSWRDELGSEAFWAAQLGRRALAAPGGVWALLTERETMLATASTAS